MARAGCDLGLYKGACVCCMLAVPQVHRTEKWCSRCCGMWPSNDQIGSCAVAKGQIATHAISRLPVSESMSSREAVDIQLNPPGTV